MYVIHGIPNNNLHGVGSQTPATDMAAQARARQAREHLENRLRIKKSEIGERHRHITDMERDITQLESGVHHLLGDVKRVEGELRELENSSKKENVLSHTAHGSMDEKDRQIHRLNDEIAKLDLEVVRFKQEIAERERKLALLRDESRGYVRQKEEFRRQFELEHFSATAESSHAHNKQLDVQRLTQEMHRKEEETAHKKQELARIKHELLLREQEVMEIEAELRRS